jgi:hypothetical protein
MWPIVALVAITVTAISIGAFLTSIVSRLERDLNEIELSQEDLESILEALSEGEDEEGSTRIIIVESKAYWLDNNSVKVAPVDDDENIDFEAAVVYNAIEAPRSELTKILFILDNLKEGK